MLLCGTINLKVYSDKPDILKYERLIMFVLDYFKEG